MQFDARALRCKLHTFPNPERYRSSSASRSFTISSKNRHKNRAISNESKRRPTKPILKLRLFQFYVCFRGLCDAWPGRGENRKPRGRAAIEGYICGVYRLCFYEVRRLPRCGSWKLFLYYARLYTRSYNKARTHLATARVYTDNAIIRACASLHASSTKAPVQRPRIPAFLHHHSFLFNLLSRARSFPSLTRRFTAAICRACRYAHYGGHTVSPRFYIDSIPDINPLPRVMQANSPLQHRSTFCAWSNKWN